MALAIETFSNATGSNAFFKAAGHPLARPAAQALVRRLAEAGPVAVYDPLGLAESFDALYPLSGANLAGYFVQKVEHLGRRLRGTAAQPVTALAAAAARTLLVCAFDAGRLIDQIRHLVPQGAEIVAFDSLKLPDALVSNPARYLDPINFATNFAFFRDAGGLHTRLVTANYWHGYGARGVKIWARLFDGDGAPLAEWRDDVPDGLGAIVIDSRDIRARFGLGEFTGQLFFHVIGAKGHDVVKYALDTWSDDGRTLSCTHDANAWPADLYAGLPAPRTDEKVVLWVQNSHPSPIPKGGLGLNRMGDETVAWLDREIPGFATHALDVADLLPGCRWPEQIEIQAGRHVVRPRYEIATAAAGRPRRRIAHPNVERTDLKPNPAIRQLGNLMGRGFLLPAPLLPPARFATEFLPTPMATGQSELPVALAVHDASGKEVHVHRFGRLARRDSVALALDTALADTGALASGYGHMVLHYDFAAGGDGDGWLHALIRVTERESGHAAETSFGSHIFNTPITFGNEPQSYSGPAPGLSTRLFLRLGEAPLDTLCHLIYPVSAAWHPHSATDLILHAGDGAETARRRVAIAANGSLLWHAAATFGRPALDAAGRGAYVTVRDTTCRLFGYHGLVGAGGAFSLDHMFGF